MVCPPWFKKWGGGTCPPPVPHQIAPMLRISLDHVRVRVMRYPYSRPRSIAIAHTIAGQCHSGTKWSVLGAQRPLVFVKKLHKNVMATYKTESGYFLGHLPWSTVTPPWLSIAS